MNMTIEFIVSELNRLKNDITTIEKIQKEMNLKNNNIADRVIDFLEDMKTGIYNKFIQIESIEIETSIFDDDNIKL